MKRKRVVEDDLDSGWRFDCLVGVERGPLPPARMELSKSGNFILSPAPEMGHTGLHHP